MTQLSRRSFMKIAAVGLAGLGGCQGIEMATQQAVAVPPAALLREYELVRLACLAANSHNTQPWLFHLEPGCIVVSPDFSRRCEQVDPENHHLWVSLGCATENILQAAPGMGLDASLTLLDEAVRINLRDQPAAHPCALGAAIPHRQSTRCDYDHRPVPAHTLQLLESAARSDSVDICLLTEGPRRRQVEALVLAANARQLDSALFRQELRQWLRFNEHDARTLGDGLFSACTGNPQVPSWLGNRLFDWFYTAQSAHEPLARQLHSSSGLILLHGERHDWRQWLETGRSAQRLALWITSLGLKMAFINQPIEVEQTRQQLATALGLGPRTPEILIRFGYASPMPTSFRHPIAAVINA